NELVFFHRITFFSVFWFWFVRDLFSNRSTPEGDGVRICQSKVRRSRATASDSDSAASRARARRPRLGLLFPATPNAWSPPVASFPGARIIRSTSAHSLCAIHRAIFCDSDRPALYRLHSSGSDYVIKWLHVK